MAIRITARHFDIGDVTKNYIENKLEKLKKLDERESDIDVILKNEKYRYTAEIIIKSGPFEAEAKEEENDLIVAFDACLKQVETRIKKQKGKMISIKKQGKKKPMTLMSVEETEEPLLRKKEIDIITMPEIEALTKFKNDELTYFLFKNLKTHKINLLIKTKKDLIELIEIK